MTFGRRATAVKRAITLVSREPQLRSWRRWVRSTALRYALPLQMSREQLLAFVGLFDDMPSALNRLVPQIINQPFTQPNAILLRALEKVRNDPLAEVRATCARAIQEITLLNDPVLNMNISYLHAETELEETDVEWRIDHDL